MQPKKQFRPANLRALLGVLLAVIILGGAALFYWGLSAVRDYAGEVNQQITNAQGSSKQLDDLRLLKSKLAQSSSLIEKANQMFSTPEAYQAQALTDIKRHADAAGLTITSTSFEADSSTATVTLRDPVSYTRLITFLSNIESNLPKLQVSSLTLAPPDNGNSGNVKTSEIKIDISVR